MNTYFKIFAIKIMVLPAQIIDEIKIAESREGQIYIITFFNRYKMPVSKLLLLWICFIGGVTVGILMLLYYDYLVF